MTSVLYYSTYCNNCKELNRWIISEQINTNNIHFVCVDKRVKKPNGETHVVLQNGSELLLPPNIIKVPALLLLNKNNHVLFGRDIPNYLGSQQQQYQHHQQQNQRQYPQNQYNKQVQQYQTQEHNIRNNNNYQNNQTEIDAFSFNNNACTGSFGVMSDNFSYWDQSPEELAAQGNGGVRQMYNYVQPDFVSTIETPPDNYSPDKVGGSDMEIFEKKREDLDNSMRNNFKPI